MSKNNKTILTAEPIPVQTVFPVDNSISSIDRINNPLQKEDKLFISGVTRAKYMVVISEALTAVKEVEYALPDGSWAKKTVADVARRQWGCERAIELFGDKVTKTEMSVGYNLSKEERVEIAERLAMVLTKGGGE